MCLRMSSGFLRIASSLVCAGTFVFLSCEEHHVGELPEVQRERGAEKPARAEEHANADTRTEAAAPTASPIGTPVDLFPEKKP